MTAIDSKTTIEEIGAIVFTALQQAGIDCFLSGGAVVSIYTNNKYESFDLDFVSLGDRKKIEAVMISLGFTKDKSRLFIHPRSLFFVEFPGSAVMVGDDLIHEFAERKTKYGTLKLLTPTDCVKDRLAAFYHWNDPQGLAQAVWVCQAHPIRMPEIEAWSAREGQVEKWNIFISKIKK